MGKSVQLWLERSESVSCVLYSPVFDAAWLTDATVLLEVLALTGAPTVQVRIEHSLDPTDPNSWSLIAVIGVGSVTTLPASFGGMVGGSTIPLGPYLRFVGQPVLGLGDRIVWSASITLRN